MANINLHHLFVHILAYNKHLLFNMRGMNIKVMDEIHGSQYQSTSTLEAHAVSETSSSIYNPRRRTHSRNSVNQTALYNYQTLLKWTANTYFCLIFV